MNFDLGFLVGCAAYFIAAMGVATVVHGFVRNNRVASGLATAISAASLLLYIEWTCGFAVKPGWVFPILIPGCAVAFPASAGVGRVFEAIRGVRPGWDDRQPVAESPPELPAQ